MYICETIHCTATCIEGELRLVEGETEWDGRLEVCLSQRWGTVGNDGWTEVNRQVVCNALGYDFTGMHTQVTKSQKLIPSPYVEDISLYCVVCR